MIKHLPLILDAITLITLLEVAMSVADIVVDNPGLRPKLVGQIFGENALQISGDLYLVGRASKVLKKYLQCKAEPENRTLRARFLKSCRKFNQRAKELAQNGVVLRGDTPLRNAYYFVRYLSAHQLCGNEDLLELVLD